MEIDKLEQMTLVELREVAKGLGIKNISRLKKKIIARLREELQEAL